MAVPATGNRVALPGRTELPIFVAYRIRSSRTIVSLNRSVCHGAHHSSPAAARAKALSVCPPIVFAVPRTGPGGVQVCDCALSDVWSLASTLLLEGSRASGRSIQLLLEAPDDSRIIVGFDSLNLSATSDDHKIAPDRLAKIVEGYLRSGTVRVHLVRACIGSLEDVAIGAVGLRSGEIPLPVRGQPSDRRKG